ncbi:hypothetical protein BJX62DRAFT_233691 [Aspergillus germanicus]
MSGSRLVLTGPSGDLQVQSYHPQPAKHGQVQVRVYATSLNHLDWKRMKKNLFMSDFPHVIGMDIAGEVIDAGDYTSYNVGDRVMAPGVVGWSDGCSYQTHALVNEPHLSKIPHSITYEEAATLPFALATAACGLFLGLGLSPSAVLRPQTPLLIWGGTGSVGSLSIQLARIHGFSPILAISSSSATQEKITRVKSHGADLVLSTDDPDLVSKVKAAAPGLQYAFDTVVSDKTVYTASQCLENNKGVIATAITYTGSPLPSSVQVKPIISGAIFGKTMSGGDDAAGGLLGAWLWERLPGWLESDEIRPLEREGTNTEIASLRLHLTIDSKVQERDSDSTKRVYIPRTREDPNTRPGDQRQAAFNKMFEVRSEATEAIARCLYRTVRYHIIEQVSSLMASIEQVRNAQFSPNSAFDPSLKSIILNQLCDGIRAVLGLGTSGRTTPENLSGMAYRSYGMFWPLIVLLFSPSAGNNTRAWARDTLRLIGESNGLGLATVTAGSISVGLAPI